MLVVLKHYCFNKQVWCILPQQNIVMAISQRSFYITCITHIGYFSFIRNHCLCQRLDDHIALFLVLWHHIFHRFWGRPLLMTSSLIKWFLLKEKNHFIIWKFIGLFFPVAFLILCTQMYVAALTSTHSTIYLHLYSIQQAPVHPAVSGEILQ